MLFGHAALPRLTWLLILVNLEIVQLREGMFFSLVHGYDRVLDKSR